MAFEVPIEVSYTILYSILALFTILAAASADLFGNILPSCLSNILVLDNSNSSSSSSTKEENINANRTPDFFLSARNSASYFTLAMSYFASGMGAWVVYGTTEMGATPQLSWLGVLGYSSASAIPAVIVCFIGPRMKSMTTNCNSDESTSTSKAFSATDFTRMRYGRIMQLSTICISVFYMFIYLVAELTSISNVYALLVGMNVFEPTSMRYMISITLSIGVITIFYTGLAGIPGSIITDKIQGCFMIIFILVLLFSFLNPENQVTQEEFEQASNWTVDGFVAAVTLFLAIASAEMFNQGTWQRVWAAKSTKDLRLGFLLGSILVFLLMMIFGILGMIAYAKDPESYDSYEKFAFLSFFDFIAPLGQAWHIVTLILVTALCASTVDTLQNALTSFLSSDLMRVGYNPKWISRLLVILINIPAIYLSVKRYDVISLFLVADLVCATSVFPVFLGLIKEDFFIFSAPTELGAFLGCISGIAAVLVNGILLGVTPNPFEYFWLRNGAQCALCGTTTMITFIVVPTVSAFCTLLFSKLDVLVRGRERAYRPLFQFSFDDDTIMSLDNEVHHAADHINVDKEIQQAEIDVEKS